MHANAALLKLGIWHMEVPKCRAWINWININCVGKNYSRRENGITENVKKLKVCIALHLPPDPTQANVSCLNYSPTGRYSIYVPQRDGRLS